MVAAPKKAIDALRADVLIAVVVEPTTISAGATVPEGLTIPAEPDAAGGLTISAEESDESVAGDVPLAESA